MRSRIVFALSMACVLAVSVTGTAAADTVSGQHGHYIFNDLSTTQGAGAGCRYSQTGPGTWSIYRIVGAFPSVWWMDTRSDITTQHGPVRWRLIVRHKSMASSTWSVLKKSAWQYRTAYEDQLNPYGNSTRAPFTNLYVNISGVSFEPSHQFMATARAEWLRADGTIRGYATHNVIYYREVISGYVQGLSPNQWCIGAYQAA